MRAWWAAGMRRGAFVAVAALIAGACSEDEAEELRKAKVAEGCQLNSDCANPLVCAFQRCHQQCNETRDCPKGQSCVMTSTGVGVCLLPDEEDCSEGGACPDGLVCTPSQVCRAGCTAAAKDCLDSQDCTGGACEDHPDGGVGGTSGSGGSGGGGTGGGGTGGTGGGGTGGTGGAGTGGVAGAGGTAGDASVGGSGGASGDASVGGSGGASGGSGGASGGSGGASGGSGGASGGSGGASGGSGGASGGSGGASGGSGGASGGSGGASGGSGGSGGSVTLPTPTHYWKLDDVGGVIVDAVGSTHGEYSGTPMSLVSVTGKVGKGVEATQATDRMKIETSTTMNGSTKLTLGLWWKPLFTTNNQTLLFRSGDFRIFYDQSKFKLEVGGVATPFAADISGGLQAGTWYHVVWVYDASATQPVKSYVNGVETGFAASFGPFPTGASDLFIGAQFSQTFGTFDEVFISQKALSATEVGELWNSGAGKAVDACTTCQPSAYWKLDDRTSSTSVASVGGSQNNLTRNLYVVPAASGRVGEAATFSTNSNSYYSVANNATQQLSSAMSVAAWYRPKAILVPATTRAMLVNKGVDASGWTLGFFFQQGGLDGPFFVLEGKGVTAKTTSLQPGTWYHFAGTFDGSMVRFYLDGVKVGEVAGPATPLPANGNALYIGRQQNGFFTGPANGDIDEVLLYDVALSDAQVATLRQKGLAGTPAHP